MTKPTAERQAAIDANLEKYDSKTAWHSPDEQGIYRVPDGVEIWFEKEITEADGEKYKHLIFATWIDASIATAAQIHYCVTEFRSALHYEKNRGEKKLCYLESKGYIRQ